MKPVVVVIVNPEGKLLASAWFSTKNKENPVGTRWVSEYPDCSEYTLGEARRTVAKLRGAGVPCEVVENYGTENEVRS